MIRTIEAFRQDDAGEWVAGLSCLHGQHVRHEPPFWDRQWVLTQEGRSERLGTPIECPLCDRGELPEGLTVVRTAGPFDHTTVPRGLLREHLVADRTWGLLEVLDGEVAFDMDTQPRTHSQLGPGDRQAIPPGIPHRLTLLGATRVLVRFLVSSERRPDGAGA